MWLGSFRSSLIVVVLGFLSPRPAVAEEPKAPASDASASAPAAPPPAAAPSAPSAPPPVPPGYMLVPIPSGPPPAETRYDVQYPQARGALPPGMELPYEEGDPIPPGYRVVKQIRRGLVIAGSITTGVPWALGVAAASSEDFKDNTGLLLIPVLGPWILLATDTARDQDCTTAGSTSVCTDSKSALRGVLVFDGLVQTAGATMFFAGMLIPRLRLVRRDVVVSVVPTTLGHGDYGLSAVGRF